MARSSLCLLAGLLLVQQCVRAQQANQDTITIQLYGSVIPGLQANILGSSRGTITMNLHCDPDSTAAGCGDYLGSTYIFGPSTLSVQGSLPGEFTFTEACSTAATTAVCKNFESVATIVYPHSSSDTSYTTSYTTTYGPADITVSAVSVAGGLDKLQNTTTSAVVITSSSALAAQSPTSAALASTTSSTPSQTSSSNAVSSQLSRVGVLGAFGVAAFQLI